MGRVRGPYCIQRRKDTGKFRLTLSETCGLPAAVVHFWKRKSYADLPEALYLYRAPTSMAEARSGALALIDYLKRQDAVNHRPAGAVTVGAWLERFTSLDDNPRAGRLMEQGESYAPGTLDVYRDVWRTHIMGDSLAAARMVDVDEAAIIGFSARLGAAKNKYGKPMARTRTYDITIRFMRMAFHEFFLETPGWADPFARLKAPKTKYAKRAVLEEKEIARFFAPGVITDPLDYAVCAAMYWAGLRISEVWGLQPDDLDWAAPQMIIRHAWKNLNRKGRVLGLPKWHKIRVVSFPDILQAAIRRLWETNGKHDFVFARKDGSIPSGSYVRNHLPKWISAAGIELNGRRIVPHSARHSLASMLEANGVPLRYIQDLLGHSDYKSTLGYLHAPQDTINRITQTIDRVGGQGEVSSDFDPGGASSGK